VAQALDTPNRRPGPGFRWGDLLAGLSIAGLLLPEAVAYSGIAGLPPQAGVAALLAGLACYGLVGTSRFAVVSATSSSAAVLLSVTHAIAPDNGALQLLLADGLILLTGVVFLIAGFARLGAASAFIAKPVLKGFTFGLAITIVLHQVPKIVGVHADAPDIFRYTAHLLRAWPAWNLTGLAIAVGALALLKIFSRWHAVPGTFIVIAAGIGLDLAGVTARHGVAAVGPIHLALAWPTLPGLPRADWLRLGELSVAMVLILYAESYGSIRGFALRHGDATAPNRDLLALGLANLASGLFHGMPVGAGYSGTSANEAAGAQSRFAAWCGAVVVAALLALFLPWIERTPEPVLAAIVIHAVGHTIDFSLFAQYFRWRRDRIVVVFSAVIVLAIGVLHGLLVAIAVSLFIMLRELSEPRVAWLGRLGSSHDYVDLDRHPEARPAPGILIARPESLLFFANADRIFATIVAKAAAMAPLQVVILSLEESPDLDGTSVEALRDFVRTLEKQGTVFMLARVKDHVQDVLRHADVSELPAACYVAWSVDDAVTLATPSTQTPPSVAPADGGA
jgi:MFS superfamily sulfate permease-like transporter